MHKKLIPLLMLSLLLNGLFSVATSAAQSAKLYVSPTAGNYEMNKNFSMTVMVDGGGGAGINAAEGVITFDPAVIAVNQLSNSNTIFKLWTTDPTYSNTAGTITFGGGLYTGFKGSAGEIFSISFTPKKTGTTKIEFKSGTALAADGAGTNVLSGFGGSNITIIEAPAAKPVTVATTSKPKEDKTQKGMVPPTPEVDSKTHPEENSWYVNNEPEFAWKLLADLTGVSFDLNNSATKDADNTNDGLVETKKYEKTADGEWFFHIKYQNKAGWGGTKTRKVLIDSTPPVVSDLKINTGNDTTNPTPILQFKAEDKTSGVDNYLIALDNERIKVKQAEAGNGSYRLKSLLPGIHNLNLSAFDKAGNVASTSISFTVDPLKAPIISEIPSVIKTTDELVIRGTSFYGNVTVKIYIGLENKDPEIYDVKTDPDGNWSYFHKGKLAKNTYQVWTKLVDGRGAESFPTGQNSLIVISPTIIELYGWYIIMSLVLLIIVLVTLLYYRNRKYAEERLRIARETNEAKLRLTEIFHALREETSELMELADKKPGLSESERRVKEKITEALEISEEFIGKEIEDITKEINMKKKD